MKIKPQINSNIFAFGIGTPRESENLSKFSFDIIIGFFIIRFEWPKN